MPRAVGFKYVRKTTVYLARMVAKPRKIMVKVAIVGKPFKKGDRKVTDQRKSDIANVPWNAIKVKGSYVHSIETKKLTEADKAKLKKLSGAELKARRKKLNAELKKLMASDNPAELKNIGRRIGEYSSKTGEKYYKD